MKRSRFSEEQIIGMLKAHEAGIPVAELCCKPGVSDASIYKLKPKFGGMEGSPSRRRVVCLPGQWNPICRRCHRRCLALYGGSCFRCRECQNLAYASQNRAVCDQTSATVPKIRERLGDVGCFDAPFPSKPKGTHWRTYEKLERECERYENQVAAQTMHVSGQLVGRFGRV